MLIKAMATEEGLNLIKDDVKENVKKFVAFGFETSTNIALDELIGNDKIGYNALEIYKIYERDIHSCYYDENGILTFELEIDYETDIHKYIYGVALINEKTIDNVVKRTIVSLSNSGKIFKTAGVGGLYIYKINITGKVAEIIYQNNDYINLETAQMLDENTLIEAKKYTDDGDVATLNSAKQFATDSDTALAQSVNTALAGKSAVNHGHALTDTVVSGILPINKGGTGNTRGEATYVAGFPAVNIVRTGNNAYVLSLNELDLLNRVSVWQPMSTFNANSANALTAANVWTSTNFATTQTLPAGGTWFIINLSRRDSDASLTQSSGGTGRVVAGGTVLPSSVGYTNFVYGFRIA